jgi:aspartate/methionine/tyrosine aminotransferase
MKINSTLLSERLVKEKSTLVVPGDHFGMDHYLRIGYGQPREYLQTGLNRVAELFESIAGRP